MSKNNAKMVQQKMADQRQKFGIRKLSIGVASVLLGTVFYLQSGTVYADVNPTASAGNDGINVVNENSSTSSSAVGSSTINRAGSTSSSSSVSSAGDATNSIDTRHVSASPVESATGQANNNAVAAGREQGSSVPTSHVNAGVDKNVKNENSNVDSHPTYVPNSQVALEKSVAGSERVDSSAAIPFQPVLAMKAETETPVTKPAIDSEAPKRETVDSKWIIHYVNQADHTQELKDPTVITMQYARTNTPQSDGKTQYGDWSYVPGSFKQTGTSITVNDSDNPVKQDNVDKDGENMDVFTITAMYPTIAGYTMHNNINGTRLHDYLRNNDRQADTMSKDFYAEYDVAKERSVAVKFVDDQSFDPDSSDLRKQVGQAITVTGHDGDTVNLNLTVPEPDKYRLADGQQLPTTYTFAKGSGDLKIHLVHKVVQREATVDVQVGLITGVLTDDAELPMAITITQNQWTQLDDELKEYGHGYDKIYPTVGVVGTLTGHVNYDLVDEKVVSFEDDWTSLNLGGQTYQMPDGTEVVNGISVDLPGLWGKSFKEYYLKYHPDIDPDYINRPWHGYLSVNATNDFIASDSSSDNLQVGLVGNEPNTLAKAIGDQAATAVKTANKTVDLSLLQRSGFETRDFSEQNGRLQGIAELAVAGVYIPYVEKTATRTINVTTPDGKTSAVKQIATLAKQVDFSKDAHPDWTTSEWASYDVPAIPGYTASQSQVAKDTVTGETKDQTVEITYTANPQTTTVVYQSEDGTPVHTTTVNGKTGQTVKVPNEVPTGWHIVNGKVPSEITFGPDGTPKTVITIDHSHVTVTPDAPKMTDDKLPDDPSKSYPAGVSENDLNKTITRTIKVTTPDGQTKTVAQTAKLTRTADVDEVTGEVTYGKWTTGKWSNYDVPTVSGYTASQNEVPATEVTSDTTDQTIDISYTANSQTIHINYVDDNTGKTVRTAAVTGKTGDTVNLNLTVPDKYQLADGQQLPISYTFTKGSGDLTVHLKHGVHTESTKLQVVADIQQGLYYPWIDNWDGNAYLPFIGHASYGDMFTNGFPEDNGDIAFNIGSYDLSYKADSVTGEFIDWVDQSGIKIPSRVFKVPTNDVLLNGSVRQSRDLFDVIEFLDKHMSVNAGTNWELQPISVDLTDTVGGGVGSELSHRNKFPSYGLTRDNTGNIEVSLQSGEAKLNVDDINSFAMMGDTHVISLPLAIGYTPVRVKNIHRIINVIKPDGKTETIDQQVKLTAQPKKDPTLSTSEVFDKAYNVVFDNWSISQWDQYTPPVVPGYTASQPVVAETTVTDQTKDQTVKITYTANPQTTTVVYQSADGTPVHTTTINGQTDQTVEVPSEVPAGWTITKGRVPSELTFGADGYDPIEVTIAHKHVTVTPDHPQDNGTNLPDNPAKTFNGVEANDLNKTITRTIKVTTPDGQTKTVTQTAKLTRTADVDEVTGDVKYGEWSTGQWDAYAVSTVPGYTASQTSVAATPVDGNTKDQTIDVHYTANSQTTHINYVDNAGKTVYTTIVTGKTGETVKMPNEVPAGWVITKGEVPSEISFGPNGHADETITIDHQHVTVDHDKPQTNGTKLPDNPAKTFEGVEANDLNKTITRTIKVTTPDGKTTTTKQTVKLTRTADVDEVTGEVTYGNWTTGDWAKYEVPSIAGYAPSQTKVDKESVTATSKDTTVEITYSPMQHQIRVEYVDDDDHGKIVKTDQVPGKTDQTITVIPSTPANYDLVDNGNRTYTVTSDDAQAVQIHVKHHQVTTSESKTVTRTINVHTPHEGDKVVKQTAELTRDVTTDQVTGEKTYGDWTTGQWESYTSEAIPGYTPSINEVPKIDVDGNSKNQMVDVTYTANAQKVEIVYVDDAKGGAVVKTDQIAGKTDETVKVTPDVPTGYELVGKVPGDYTMTADGHQTITVHLVHQMKTASESKTATRTINVHTPHDGTKMVKQTAELTRDVTTDLVTGEKTYGKWSTTSWDRYAVPAVAGYVPSIEQVAQQVVNCTTTDQTIDVTYSSGEHTTYINYVDGDGNIVHTTTIKGQTDGTAQVPNETPAGWTVVGKSVPIELTFGPDGHADVTVTVDHQHVTVTSDQPRENGTKLPDNDQLTFNGVGESDLNKTLTRTITLMMPADKTKTITQIAKLTRMATVDEVTGAVTYGNWTTAEWHAVIVPSVQGYTPSQKTISNITVKSGYKDVEQTVVYAPDTQSIVVNYIDDATGKTLKTDTLTGKSDQASDYTTKNNINGYENQHYVLVRDDTQGKTLTFDHDDSRAQVYNVHLSHQTEPVSQSRTVREEIHYVYADGSTAADTVTAKPLTFTQTGVKDLVTNAIAWNDDWTSKQTFADVKSPELTGYTASQKVIDPITVDHNSNDIHQTVIYNANDQTAKIKYIDAVTGKTLETDSADGKFNGLIKFGHDINTQIKAFEGQGYKFKSNSFNGQKYQADNSQNKFEVHFTHGTQNVSRTNKVTETVKYQFTDGHQAQNDYVQTAEFTQHGVQDLVTKTTDWAPSDPQIFVSVDTPHITGYTADIQTVPAVTVNFGNGDITKVVTYKANDQLAGIKYIDDTTGKILDTDSASGKFGTKIELMDDPLSMIQKFEDQGYKLVSNSFAGQDYQADNSTNQFTVHFEHEIKNVTRTSTVTRTIKYVDQKTGKEIHQPVIQTLTFTENGTMDLVTDKTTWTVPSAQSFSKIESPKINGYENPDISVVDSDTAKFGDEDQTVIVNYQKVEIPSTSDTPKATSHSKTSNSLNTSVTPANTISATQNISIQPSQTSTPQTTNNHHTSQLHQTDNKHHAHQLPQTGNKNDSKLELLGLISMAFAGLFGFGKRRKKRD